MPTVHLSEYLVRENILWDLPASDKAALLRDLASAVASRSPGVEASDILGSIEEREAIQSTGIGQGLALPHAMVPGIEKPMLVVARLDPPVDFSALDGGLVDLVFLLLSPPDGLRGHLRLLARMARILGHEEVLEQLRNAPGPDEAHTILIDEDARHV